MKIKVDCWKDAVDKNKCVLVERFSWKNKSGLMGKFNLIKVNVDWREAPVEKLNADWWESAVEKKLMWIHWKRLLEKVNADWWKEPVVKIKCGLMERCSSKNKFVLMKRCSWKNVCWWKNAVDKNNWIIRKIHLKKINMEWWRDATEKQFGLMVRCSWLK